jgi:hypothetical protein
VKKEDTATAARHAIYKAGTATRQQVADGTIGEESLKAKGFVKSPETGDWRRLPAVKVDAQTLFECLLVGF